MNGRSAKRLSKNLYPELERRLAKVKPDLLIARQGIKLKFNDFQLTTQEHVWPRLNKEDLIATAHKAWDERRGRRGRAPGWAPRDVARSAAGKQLLLGI
ncbi:DNA polymerase IV [Klebsiella pneumoniae]|uniref:DNA polymerase IV n=1 Tax=Klebsiella pneumoniae TaxID=573 RepID=A0A377XQP7_KLEPN|nr:DNA polymerase IV [Klebsiella pneumoniae]